VKALAAAGITVDELAAEAHLPAGLVHNYLPPGVPGGIEVEL